jgi:hypothetical protein
VNPLPAVLDVEASGFGRGSYPIEIGFVASDGASFCSLIRPLPDWQHWDADAEALHGIDRATLLAHGRPAAWVAAELNRRLHGQTVYCDGWGRDYPWLARLFDSAGLQPSFQLQDLRCLLSEDQALCWHEVCEQVRAELEIGRHRASSDARVLQTALQRLLAVQIVG